MTDSVEAPPTSERSAIRGTTGVPSGTKTPPATTEQLVVTRNSSNGDVVKLEFINETGQRSEIPQENIDKIVGEDEIAEITSALDEAFDAGVAMLLEEADDEEEVETNDAERSAILRLLLIPLVGRATVRRLASAREKLLRKLFLRRLIRRYALQHRIAAS